MSPSRYHTVYLPPQKDSLLTLCTSMFWTCPASRSAQAVSALPLISKETVLPVRALILAISVSRFLRVSSSALRFVSSAAAFSFATRFSSASRVSVAFFARALRVSVVAAGSLSSFTFRILASNSLVILPFASSRALSRSVSKASRLARASLPKNPSLTISTPSSRIE